jgi:hypothetical protein
VTTTTVCLDRSTRRPRHAVCEPARSPGVGGGHVERPTPTHSKKRECVTGSSPGDCRDRSSPAPVWQFHAHPVDLVAQLDVPDDRVTVAAGHGLVGRDGVRVLRELALADEVGSVPGETRCVGVETPSGDTTRRSVPARPSSRPSGRERQPRVTAGATRSAGRRRRPRRGRPRATPVRTRR